MFEGFTDERVALDEVVLRVRHGGSGPPLLLVHGHPRTGATWHRVASLLADEFTVVCPDTRGYGASSNPPTKADHSQASKRAMAADFVDLMRTLGHRRFAVAGHDRGSYVAYRLALDHPHEVTKLVVLDGVPIGEALARADARFAQSWWHWFFLGVEGTPERVINADPDAWYAPPEHEIDPDALVEFRRAIHDPETVHAMVEDYRAGLGVDRVADDSDRARGRRFSCPALFGYSTGDDMETLYGDPLAIWRNWADDIHSVKIESGHHMTEESPAALAAALREFLAS